MSKVKYLLFPDYVYNSFDRQLHFVNADQLARCYGVKMSECAIADLRTGIGSSNYRNHQRNNRNKFNRNYVRFLHVRYDGNYRFEYQFGQLKKEV